MPIVNLNTKNIVKIIIFNDGMEINFFSCGFGGTFGYNYELGERRVMQIKTVDCLKI